MSTDDRFEEIKRLLDSTISEFQTLFESAGGFEDSRVGNGWTPEKITADIYYLPPKPIPELIKIAESRKRSLFKNRVLGFLKPKDQDVHQSEHPKLRLIPFWRVKGYHECFYFRGNDYKIDLPEDVIAVEVEGKIRDLVGTESTDAQGIAQLAKRFLGRKESTGIKSFRLSDVTELAYKYDEGTIFVNSHGREDLEAEAFFDHPLPLKKTSVRELESSYPGVEIAANSFTQEELVRRLHSLIVKPPAAFSKILSNRFQVSELVQYLMPLYSFQFEWRGQKKRLSVHGYTGAIFQS